MRTRGERVGVARPSSAGTILIVDEDIDQRRVMASLLASQGFRTRLARDGREGVRKALDPQVDVVLMDIRMPGMDGIDAMLQVRQQNPKKRGLFVTAHSREYAKRLEDENLHDCGLIDKPITHDNVDAFTSLVARNALAARLEPIVSRLMLAGLSRSEAIDLTREATRLASVPANASESLAESWMGSIDGGLKDVAGSLVGLESERMAQENWKAYQKWLRGDGRGKVDLWSAFVDGSHLGSSEDRDALIGSVFAKTRSLDMLLMPPSEGGSKEVILRRPLRILR